jgi:hypothetical protein
MAGGFKRSSRFGIVGVLLVMVLVAAIALTMGSGADPKRAMALIFGVIAVFFVILFVLQRSDLDRAAGLSRSGTERGATEGGHEIYDPTTLTEPELWAALAVRPIDRDAVEARSELWNAGRRSLNLGVAVVALIFLTVPAMYLLESFVPLLIGGPLIVLVALYGAWRVMAPGGEIDAGYERVGRAMAPLGLEVAERPTVKIEMREPTTPRMGPRIHGALVLRGQRHGREVTVRLGGEERSGASEIRVAAPAPADVDAVMKALPDSPRWSGVKVSGEGDGIVVARTRGQQSDWLCDLWLAERLATR